MSVQIADGPLLPAARDVRVFDDRASWEAGRFGGCGASDIAAILRVHPEKSDWDVYAKRVLGASRVSRSTQKLFRRGHREEPRILEDYSDITGDAYIHIPNVIVDGPSPMSVSPDAFLNCGDMGRQWGNCEAKSDRSPFRWGRSGVVIEKWSPDARAIVREDYAAQSYAQMLADGLPYTRLIVRRDMDDLRWYTIMADERLQSLMLERVQEWWDKHIVQGIPPDPDGTKACLQAQAILYGVGENGRAKLTRKATSEEIELARTAHRASEEAKRAEHQKDKARSKLAELIGDGYGVEWDGPSGRNKVLYIDKQGSMTVDVDRLKAEFPDVYAVVARQSPPSREIRLYLQDK